MNAQFKKGVLELVVLESVRKKDMYGYELVEEVSKVIDVKMCIRDRPKVDPWISGPASAMQVG